MALLILIAQFCIAEIVRILVLSNVQKLRSKLTFEGFAFEFKSLQFKFSLNRGFRSEKHFQSCFLG